MKRLALALVGLLLTACGLGGGPYHQKNGQWFFEKYSLDVPPGETLTPLNNRFAKTRTVVFYRDARISGADAASFQALTEHYAKDRRAVYYADTFRRGQEYYAILHIKVVELDADPASFRVLDSRDASTALGYARDKDHVWFEGQPFPGPDAASFAPMRGGFARDARQVFYTREPMPVADPASFEAIDDSWSKDAGHVFWSDVDLGSDPAGALVNRVTEGADPKTFQALDGGYGKDAAHVFFEGRVVEGADPASFVVREGSDPGDAHDKNGDYNHGEAVRVTPPLIPGEERAAASASAPRS
jgi:hypothetical protein